MLSRVPVNVVVCQLMAYSDVIVGIAISRGSFVFSQSRVKVSASLTNELVNCSLSVVRFVSVFHVGQ